MAVKVKPVLSNTEFKVRVKRKTNPSLVETIKLAQKNNAWKEIAKILSSSTRHYSSINLSDIDKETTAGDTILVLGKVLGSGDLTKKVRIVALSISESARTKLKATKSEYVSIADEIKINAKFAGVKIIQ